LQIAGKSRLRLISQTDSPARLLTVSVFCSMQRLTNLPSFQRSIDHGQYVIQLHAWLSPKGASFATFIFEKARERLCGISPAGMRTKSFVKRWFGAMRIRKA
jgi:hypothetical protein